MLANIIIKNVELKDIEKIHQIELENYGNDEATELETFYDIVKYADSEYKSYKLMVASDDDILYGFYCIGVEDNGKINLFDIAVNKNFQNQGVGALLIKSILAEVRNIPDIKLIHLIVREDNTAAIRLYKRFGFIEEVEKIFNYYGDCSAIYMECSWEVRK